MFCLVIYNILNAINQPPHSKYLFG